LQVFKDFSSINEAALCLFHGFCGAQGSVCSIHKESSRHYLVLRRVVQHYTFRADFDLLLLLQGAEFLVFA